jgi:site-specific DNA recombinase
LERSARGRRGRAQAGYVVPGGINKYGYRYVPDPQGHKGIYEIVPEEAAVVRLIFQWYVYSDETGKKLGNRAIAQKLSDMRVPTRNDNTKYKYRKTRGRGIWNNRTIACIIRSETYTGVHYYNRTKRTSNSPDKDVREVRDRSEWIAVPVPAIIDRQTWELAQQQIAKNIRRSKRNTKGDYLMRGRLHCQVCGYMMNCETNHRHPKNRR